MIGLIIFFMSENFFINKNERLDNLNFSNYKIIQDPQKFCFGLDSVLLANFVRAKKNDTIIDLGCGNGVICILLAAKLNVKKIIGLEIQNECVDLARRNLLLNNLQDKIEIIHGDVKNIGQNYKNKFDVVVTNPPYLNSGAINKNMAKAIARHEILCNITDVISNAATVLKNGGKFFMVHRPQRLTDIFYFMRKFNLEPKTLQIVHSFINLPSQLILIEGVKNSKSMLKILPPLIIYDDNKNYTRQLKEIYENF